MSNLALTDQLLFLLYPQGEEALLQQLHCNLLQIEPRLNRINEVEEEWTSSRNTFEEDIDLVLIRHEVITGVLQIIAGQRNTRLQPCPSHQQPEADSETETPISHSFADMKAYLVLRGFEQFVEFTGHKLLNIVTITPTL